MARPQCDTPLVRKYRTQSRREDEDHTKEKKDRATMGNAPILVHFQGGQEMWVASKCYTLIKTLFSISVHKN
jgi:hypothetical protein